MIPQTTPLRDGERQSKVRPLLTIKELHAELDGAVGINFLYEAARNPGDEGLRTVRVGRKILVPAEEVEAWLGRLQRAGGTQ